MKETLEAIAGSSLPTILGIGGIAFLFLALVGRVGGKVNIDIPSERRKSFARAGIALLLIGVFLEVLPFLLSRQDAVEPLSRGDTVESSPSSQGTVQPVLLESPPLSVCDLASAPFRVGDEVEVVLKGYVRVRRTPGINDEPDTVCYASTGETFWVVNAIPECTDGIWWWKVSNNRCGEGWIAQHRQNGVAILDYP